MADDRPVAEYVYCPVCYAQPEEPCDAAEPHAERRVAYAKWRESADNARYRSAKARPVAINTPGRRRRSRRKLTAVPPPITEHAFKCPHCGGPHSGRACDMKAAG